MKYICFNCNGIRSATSKGLMEFIQKENADIVALQEIKATEKDIGLEFWERLGYFPFIFSAEKKGYSGTAVFSKLKPKSFSYGLGHDFFDKEGRVILLEFKDFAFVNTYFPSGTSGEDRQKLKMEFLDYYNKKFIQWKKKYKKIILCGDVNIAHKEIDIHNPKGNEKNSGFLPEE
ncbi:MAG: endonuclease/exonuclease/phosphatase family protein, partial [Leptospiraceae bacterium]|nr:endonuclease/exonuclease/phosphatase family protein [Leptospiraceae bacterium]